MLPATEAETERVVGYMQSQAPDLAVQFVQKVYSENVIHVRHDVWDVHTDADRWWVITEPMNLYSQRDFPNMDLALTCHVGLCLRIPRSERSKLSELPIEPFAECYRYMEEASEALRHAHEVSDYQAIGVRCRECLLAFGLAGRAAIPWKSEEEPPKDADFKAWTEHIFNTILPGGSNEQQRHLLKTLLDSAWKVANWLTHAKSSHWHDAEAAVATTENAVTLAVSALIRFIRGVPDECPACGSQRLSPERGSRTDDPETDWERPTCDKCGWTGTPMRIDPVAERRAKRPSPAPASECVVPTVPLRTLTKPASTVNRKRSKPKRLSKPRRRSD